MSVFKWLKNNKALIFKDFLTTKTVFFPLYYPVSI